jgi:molecular chaperone DnaK
MASGERYVGIDLGTTNSTAAMFDGERVTLIRNSDGSPLTPSVVRINARGQVLVGAKARRYIESDPENTKSEFKRLMGTAQAIEFPSAKMSKKPEHLSAEVLRSLRDDVNAQLGFLPDRAVISVPALFELPQSSATSDAARLAGFERVELLQEPIASALAAGWTASDATGTWLVYDLGGGTFDASLLETRDGLLRVVGHDGDNFLGGRDIDNSIVDWAISAVAKERGVQISKANAGHAPAIRKIKLAAEEVKIELSRKSEASLVLPQALLVGGEEIEVDLSLDRATLDALALPLIERTLLVCRRLLAAHGVPQGSLARVVLVGGPTVMPILRARVEQGLSAPLGEGLDPMTLVAQGAAIYAATAGLDARPTAKVQAAARRFWLQYPAMCSDLTPHVIGKLVEGGTGPAPAKVKLSRSDGLWEGAQVKIDDEGAFVTTVALVPRRPNVFAIRAEAEDGTEVGVDPPTLTIMQGLTITDPPLSRTIGVALADDTVCVYFERGSPLPARRTFVHRTVESVAKDTKDSLLKIPIVQGELEKAHLCRLVGTLEISGEKISSSLPASSDVELTLELDRGGRLSARALVSKLGQVFEEVAHLLVPEASPEVLEASVRSMRERIHALRSDAFKNGRLEAIRKLAEADESLARVEEDTQAAKGGDADAGQKAKRMLIELDLLLEEVELDKSWTELDLEAKQRVAQASRWVSAYGTHTEKQLLVEVTESCERARKGRDPLELQRQLRLVRDLGNTAFYRHPDAWRWMFESAASEADNASDLPNARMLVKQGRSALEKNDMQEVRTVTERLWRLLPADAEERHKSYGSSVR